MNWGAAMLLRLVALAAGLFFIYCEADGTYEFLVSQQPRHAIDFVVLAGTGFAVALGLLPMYAGHAFKHRQWGIAFACWLAVPIVMAVVYYAAIQRTGGGADQAEVERLRTTRTGTLTARTEKEATKSWEDARDAAKTECATGRGRKCTDAETKRDAAWAAVVQARTELSKTPETAPDSGARRVVAFLPFLTEAQVRLYQPKLIPVGISMLASVFLTIGMLLHTPPMPRPWQRWRRPPSAPAMIDIEPEPNVPTFRPPKRPKLVTSSPEGAGSIPKILHEILEPAGGSRRIEIKDCHDGYAARCRAEGKRAVPPLQFIDTVKEFCRRAGIKTKTEGDRFYLVGVQLAPLRGREVS
jgi:hypothetical protein